MGWDPPPPEGTTTTSPTIPAREDLGGGGGWEDLGGLGSGVGPGGPTVSQAPCPPHPLAGAKCQGTISW